MDNACFSPQTSSTLPRLLRALRVSTLSLLVLLSTWPSLGGEIEGSSKLHTAIKSPWTRIVMAGASVTAGFTESEPLGGPATAQYRLSRYVEAAILAPHEPVHNLGSSMFFLRPEDEARQQIEQALKIKPTLVVAIDFLFWFCYGEGSTDQLRLQRFEKGLKILEPIECPLVIGDIPDASAALEGMLTADQIPTSLAMAAANRRLRVWAAARKQTVVVPLTTFMRTVVSNQELSVHDHTFPAGKTRVLLQSDMLHPSAPGCAVLAVTILDALRLSSPAVSAGEVLWDPKEVYRLALKPATGTPSKAGN
jgi:hypothetical protein